MDRVPILKIGEVLLVSIQVDMQDQVASQLQTDLGERIVDTGCRGVIIDITGLDIVDSFVGRTLSTIASISRVLDAETIVVGMRPAVAITLVELGLSLNGIRTALNVERGMELLAASAVPDAGLVLPSAADDDIAHTLPAESGQEKRQLT
jgi:rsbT antagonist protein RsbS